MPSSSLSESDNFEALTGRASSLSVVFRRLIEFTDTYQIFFLILVKSRIASTLVVLATSRKLLRKNYELVRVTFYVSQRSLLGSESVGFDNYADNERAHRCIPIPRRVC